MPTFHYKAKDNLGNTVTGTVDADSRSHAASVIREMGRLPMAIEPVAAPRQDVGAGEAGSAFARYVIFPLWTGVNIKALAIFHRQLATLLGSGMSLSEALGSAGNRTGGRLGRIVGEAVETVQRGGRFSDVLARHPHVFSRLQLSLVRVGEAGGMLDKMVDRIASHLEYEISVRRMIGKMTLYPVLILLFAFAAYVSLAEGKDGAPRITLLITQTPVAFLRAIWPQVRIWLMWAVGIVVVLKILFQFDSVKLVWDTVKIVPPILGTTARKIAMSRFSRALALLYAAGMSIAESVSVAAEASANLAVSRAIKCAVPAIQAGQGLTESLAETGALMPIVIDMLATGERTGGTDAVLDKVADYLDDEADASIQKMGIALFVLMILVAAGIVLSILVKFYLGIAANVMRQAQ